MSSQETYATSEKVHLNESELDELEQLCGIEADLYGGRTDTVLGSYLFSMRIFGSRRGEPCVSDTDVGNILSVEAARFVFETYYPNISEEDLRQIATIDAGAFSRGDRFTFMDSSKWELEDFQSFVTGTEDKLPVNYRGLSADDPSISPVVADRIRDGLPRPLQLVLASKILADLSDSSESFKYNFPAFQNIVNTFDMTDYELIATFNMARSCGAPSARYVTHHIIANKDTLDRFITNDSIRNRLSSDNEGYDTVVEELLGGATSIKAALTEAFSHPPEHWSMVVDNLSSELVELYLPFEERRTIVLNRMREWPHMPSEHEQEYVSPGEIAQITYDKVLESLNGELPNWRPGGQRMYYSKAHAAVEFGVDDVPFRLQKLDEYKGLVTLLEMTADEESELGITAQVWRNRIKGIDPYLDEQFELYTREMHNRDLDPLPVFGWTGDPEEDDIIEAHNESRDRSITNMKKIKAEVTEYLAETQKPKPTAQK